MRNLPLVGLCVVLAMVAGCASTAPKKEKTAPGWYQNPPPGDESHLYAATVSESRRMDVAAKKAKTDGRAELARQMGIKVQNLEKLFQEEVGADAESELLEQFTSVTKTVTSETLHGVQEEEKETQSLEDGRFRVYVLMSLPIGAANQAMLAKLKANEHLYTRFRATQAFEELDAEVKAFEAERAKEAP